MFAPSRHRIRLQEVHVRQHQHQRGALGGGEGGGEGGGGGGGWGERSHREHRAPTVTCGAVHHVGRHAVGRRLGVHQPGAVVHGLAVGRAGGHQSALVHARKPALPAERSTAHALTTRVHSGRTRPRAS